MTADFCYYRYRKPSYTAEERHAMLDRIHEHLGQERNVFAYFKHEETPEGALYAVEILKENLYHRGHRGPPKENLLKTSRDPLCPLWLKLVAHSLLLPSTSDNAHT